MPPMGQMIQDGVQHRWWCGLAALALLAGACDRSQSDGPSCEDRTTRLANRLAALVESSPMSGLVPAGLDPIESSAGAALDGAGSIVGVRKDGSVTLDFGPPMTIEEVAQRLAERAERDRQPAPVLLWADRAAPAELVARVAAVAPAGYPVRLMAVGPVRPREPYDAELEATAGAAAARAAAALAPGERATEIARQMERAVGPCASLARVFADVGGEPPEGKARHMARAAPRALRECDCKAADMDAIEYILLSIFGAYERPIRWFPAAAGAPANARTAADLVPR